MNLKVYVSLGVALLRHTAEAAVHGADPAVASRYTGENFSCADGSKVMSTSRVNDDYCDCRDGSDEPGTSACPNGSFYCVNNGYLPSSIPSSRVGDGICDCCDGSDEEGCSNTCTALAQEALAGLREELSRYQGGLALRSDYVQRAETRLSEKRSKLAQLKEELATHEIELEELHKRKEETEQEETAERQRRDELREAEEKKLEEEQAQVEQEAQPEESESSAGEEQGGEEKENFPYPQEYAAPAEEEEESFPYPQEYAAPGVPDAEGVEEHVYEYDDEDDLPDVEDAGPYKSQDPGHWRWVATLLHSLTDYIPGWLDESSSSTSIEQEAQEARDKYNEANNKRRTLDREIKEITDHIDIDFGPDQVFAALYGECFSSLVGKYTYEFCPFDKGAQKEGASSTSIGKWGKWEEEGQYTAMLLDNGQSCWQGPRRSFNVKFECGLEDRLYAIAEPSKCTYTAVLSTPAACAPAKEAELRARLESGVQPDAKEEL